MQVRPYAEVVPVSEDVVRERLAAGGPALVALSGGVDSGLVASLAREALGPRAEAVTLSGSAVPASEVEQARQVARAVGIVHTVLPADPIGRAEYRENPPDRCYHCRAVESQAVRAWGGPRGFVQFLDGVQADDLAEDRPGIRAMDEAGFRHPLLEAGWDKPTVRALARRRGLPNWDRPSNACLASRVAHGYPITPELLARVERAESELLRRGFQRVRVRVGPTGARIEVGPDEVARLLTEPGGAEAQDAVRAMGFGAVTVDPRGYGGLRSPLRVVR